MTVEEFERIAPPLDSPSELVDGKLRLMTPTNYRHGLLSAEITHILKTYLDAHPEMGEVVGAETGFRINDPHYPVQAPDAGFIRAERAPREEQGKDDPLDHFMVGPPDLAVEVRSPSERFAAVRAKAERWPLGRLRCGSSMGVAKWSMCCGARRRPLSCTKTIP